MLVGDLIIGVRELGPDPCQVLLPPVLASAVSSSATGGLFAPGNYFVVLTTLNVFGESVASNEIEVTVAPGNNAIQITFATNAVGGSVTGIRFYVGVASGVYSGWYTVLTNGQFMTGVGGTAGSPPTLNRTYLPDTDGGFASAYTLYRWLNEALRACARVTNGIQDTAGIASISGQRRYVAPGQWLRFDQCFYDGWELDLGNKAETFRNRNLTANISISLMVDAQSDTTRIELYWTPSRTSGTTTTTGPILATDATLDINPASGWLLQDGCALITDPTGVTSEIITYSSQSSAQMTGCIRGWAGTQPAAFATGSTITELNIELTGYRMPYVYSVGQSLVNLGVPPGWEPFVKQYMLGLYRDAEQERQEASDLMKQATTGLEAWVKSNKPVAGPRQCRMYGDFGIRGLVPGGLTGGLIIP